MVAGCYFNFSSFHQVGRGKFTLNDVDPELCTHLIYPGVEINSKFLTLTNLNNNPDVTAGGTQGEIILTLIFMEWSSTIF